MRQTVVQYARDIYIYISMRLLRYCYLRNGKKIIVRRAATLNHTPEFILFTHDKIDFMSYVPAHVWCGDRRRCRCCRNFQRTHLRAVSIV